VPELSRPLPRQDEPVQWRCIINDTWYNNASLPRAALPFGYIAEINRS